MTFEYDEKGKIFTDIVSKVAVPATIQTTTHLLRGVFMSAGTSASKMNWITMKNSLRLPMLAYWGRTDNHSFTSPFVAVQRAHIVWVIPEQNQDEGKGS